MAVIECVHDLDDNEKDIRINAMDTLLRISSNVLKNPMDPKFRSLKLSSSAILTKLIPASGGMECLFAMGFNESPVDPETLVLPLESSLEKLKLIHDQIERLKVGSVAGGGDTRTAASSAASSPNSFSSHPHPASLSFPSSIPSPALLRSELSFRRKLESGLATVRKYEDSLLQRKALACVPLDRLKREAETLHESVVAAAPDAASDAATSSSSNAATSAAVAAPEIGSEDCLALLLIRWFKREFFKWVNQPKCEKCDGKTTASGKDAPTSEEALWQAGNVELYRCSSCSHVTRFPRYNHPGKLLETRRGRCGEWANCFGLVSRACGFETRYVLDWTDHVWTEYYSKSQDRWVHGDTCEEGHDKPLLYEHGWGKKLTYVIAFSVDDIQDVTCRYTTKQSQVLARRQEIRENVLVATIMQMRVAIQASVSTDRKNELLRRCVLELAEFLGCDNRVIAKGELSGRQSGSLSWRLSRGETGAKQSGREVAVPEEALGKDATMTTSMKKAMTPTTEEVGNKRLRLKYFPVKDCYVREQSSASSSTSASWDSLASKNENVEMKIEHDWEMTYLARKPGCGQQRGTISWRVDLKGAAVKSKSVELLVTHQGFESGEIEWILCSDDSCQKISPAPGQSVPLIVNVEGSEFLELKAVLSGGTGNNSWQHAQLFRTKLDDREAVGLDWTVNFQ